MGEGYAGRLRKEDWLVADVPPWRARGLVARHHYARGASNTATHLHGLYRRSDYLLAGVAWWLPPTRSAAVAQLKELRLDRLLPLLRYGAPVAALTLADLEDFSDPDSVLTLSRLALTPEAPKNAATFLLAASVKRLAPRWRLLLTYADTWQGHAGHIYRASGWRHLGRTKAERVYVREGRMVARKAGPKTRTHAEMLGLGAVCVGAFPKERFRLVRMARPIPSAQGSLFDGLAA
jgi:hypothetical protein